MKNILKKNFKPYEIGFISKSSKKKLKLLKRLNGKKKELVFLYLDLELILDRL